MEAARPTAAAPERRSPTPAATRKREAVRHLKDGLDHDRFVLHYQPLVEARGETIGALEALLRRRDGEAADLPHLVHAAERSPVIFRLQDWTLQQAALAARAWRDAGGSTLPRVSVNVSARVLPRSRLVGRVRRQLKACGLPPEALALEITETSSLTDFAAVRTQLDEILAMGVELWLDDFGTGHSSLEWLSHLPVHGIKIAATFVERLAEGRCRTIVTRVIEMAHDLGLRVAAEGIETEEQKAFLLEHRCDRFQGFLFHPPLPAGQVPAGLAGAAVAPAS